MPHMDYPHVRSRTLCVSCKGGKDRGLILCWPCHRRYKSSGYPAGVQAALDRAEAHSALHGRFAPRPPLDIAANVDALAAVYSARQRKGSIT